MTWTGGCTRITSRKVVQRRDESGTVTKDPGFLTLDLKIVQGSAKSYRSGEERSEKLTRRNLYDSKDVEDLHDMRERGHGNVCDKGNGYCRIVSDGPIEEE